MNDPRLKTLARQLVRYSVALKTGEHLQINCTPDEMPLAKELVRATYEIGAYPHLNIGWPELQKEILNGLTQPQAEVMAEYLKARAERIDAVISIGTTQNPMENAEIPPERMQLYAEYVDKIANKRVCEGKVRWSVAIYPTPYYASCAGMSLDAFTDYYFKVCCLDYEKLGNEMDKLKNLLEQTDKVRILAPGTDLSFSVKGIDKMSSKGDRNVPDGEVYTAPVLNSINGHIVFNIASVYRGMRFDNIALEFHDGKASVSDRYPQAKALNAILDGDDGARYIGEFALGVNPYLTCPMGLTLFDEKMNGSIHMALGNALDLTDNQNRSAIHWDLVQSHRPEHGGGQVYFDGVLVRENGAFLPPELAGLNRTDF